jgi:hypothetical protein
MPLEGGNQLEHPVRPDVVSEWIGEGQCAIREKETRW